MVRRGLRPILFVAVLVVIVTGSSVPAPATSDDSPSPTPFSADLREQFPYCSWWVETSTQNSNVLYPDTAAAYWTMPFRISDDSVLTLRGYFPDTRYFSIQVYDETGQPDDSVGATGITDYQLMADPGSTNPWKSGGSYPTEPQTYTLTLSTPAAKPSGITNWLSMPPSSSGEIGWLMLRVYLPDNPPFPASLLGGATSELEPPFDLVARVLPTVTLNGDEPLTFPQCSPGQRSDLMINKPEGSALSTLHAGVDKELIFSGMVDFVRPTNTQTPFPNADSAYVAAKYGLEDRQALVVTVTLPTSPWDSGDGFGPTLWPDESLQMRYLSFCNYLHEPPFPAVEETSGGQTIWGCASDVEIHEADSADPIVAVVTAPDQRPSATDALSSFVWLPTNSGQETAEYVFAIRNMLPNSGFAESATNVTTTDSAAAAAEVMRSYYPQAVVCDISALEERGPTNCRSTSRSSDSSSSGSSGNDFAPETLETVGSAGTSSPGGGPPVIIPRREVTPPQNGLPVTRRGPVLRSGVVPRDVRAPEVRIGGRLTSVQSTVTDPLNLFVRAGVVFLGVQVERDQGSVSQSEDGTTEIAVRKGARTTLSGSGLRPESMVQVFLPLGGSNAKELTRISVAADGSFNGDAAFVTAPGEDPLPIGRQVLQLVSVDENGDEVVVDMTANIAQPSPAPEFNREEGVIPTQSTGTLMATNGGVPEQVTVSAVEEQKLAVVEGDGWSMAIAVTAEDGLVAGTDGGVSIELVRDESARVSGDGFMPGTRADVWLFSEPTLLGSVTIDDEGRFDGEVNIDGRVIAAGNHTLQLQGVGEDGYVRAANIGVTIDDAVVAVEEPAETSVMFIWWVVAALITLVLAVILWFAARRRRWGA